MKKSKAINPLLKFIIWFISTLVIWFLFYELILHKYTRIDRIVIDNLISISSFLLDTMGYDLIPKPDVTDNIRTIGIDGTHGLWIGDSCNGITILAVYAIFILTFPGNWINKLWYVPLGMLILHFVNVIRICVLAIIVTIDYNLLQINHDYIFLLVVWSFVFLLWFRWINKYSGISAKK